MYTVATFYTDRVLLVLQAMSLLEAFNKDRSLMPQPLGNPPPLAPLPTIITLPPDARTQEMIKEKLKKAEELGMQYILLGLLQYSYVWHKPREWIMISEFVRPNCF